MLSSIPTCLTIRKIGSRAPEAGRNLVERKKNITSLHLRTGLMDSAYAAGIAKASTNPVDSRMAIAELIKKGATPRSNRAAKLPMVSGARGLGGLVAASTSSWKAVSAIHATGMKNINVSVQAPSAQIGPPRLPRVGSSRRARRRETLIG